MSNLPSPGQLLGMPRFNHWYPNQRESFIKIMQWYNSDARFLGLESPTGSGKSLSLVLAAQMSGERTIILTATKGLMEQYVRDYGEIGMVAVKGQNNYLCPESVNQRLRCDEGPCHEGYVCPQKESATCPYHKQLQVAVKSQLVVTNYAYWLAQSHFSSGIGTTSVLALDEAHLAFSALESHLVIMLSKMETESLGLKMPRFHLEDTPPAQDSGKGAVEITNLSPTTLWNKWRNWAANSKATASLASKDLEDQIKQLRQSGQNVGGSLSRQFRSAKSIVGKLESMSQAKGKWVVQPYNHGWMFTPVWVADYSHLLFRNVPKVMLMSAILSLKTVEKLGIPVWEDAVPKLDSGMPKNTEEVEKDGVE